VTYVGRFKEELAIRSIKKIYVTTRIRAAWGTVSSSKISYIPLDHNLENVDRILNIRIENQAPRKCL
jgi:hypothetical protein